ncbi:MAG: ribonuclease H-like domain-containing protein [Lachnospiraceae bacterium]|nr:ribonuclease H-like domain-containing protein [Lachnospiraceae bacterium]
MIIQTHTLKQDILPFPAEAFPTDALFFDIETTGLSHRTSHLYLVGAIYKKNEEFLLTQWFLQRPSEEKQLLEEFAELLKEFSSVIHYNGQSFDIPYLQDRCAHWQLPDPFSDDSGIRSTDLYRELRPMKQLFSLSSMKQKDMETFLCCHRQDQFSGKELIQVYHTYLQTAGEEELKLLLLHNHDDLLGMLPIYQLYIFLKTLKEKPLQPSLRLQQNLLILEAHTELPCPAMLKITREDLSLSIKENRILVTLQGYQGCFRHYYSNYRDYFYLPLEDTAIHKSVGIYVDPSCREKARADTCYTKKEGLFFFQPTPLFLPDFRQDRRKGPSFFLAEQPQQNPELLPLYLQELLLFILHR